MLILAKGAPTRLSLDKTADPAIRVNLNWDATTRRGFLGLGSRTVRADLDLGCMYTEFRGACPRKGVIQALGESFGTSTEFPWITLDKDDRTGAAADGENLRIDRPTACDRILIFGWIYGRQEGVDFTTVGARLTLTHADSPPILVRLDNPDAGRTFCAIALVESRGSDVTITKEERYFSDHIAADKHYGFGFRWTTGRK